VVIASPFPGDKALEPVRVTLTYDPGRVLTIAEKLAAEGRVEVVTGAQRWDLVEPVNFRVEAQPWLEAFLAFQAETGAIAAIRENRMFLSISKERALPGAWCVAGPFAAVITDVKHNMTRSGTGSPEGDEQLYLQGYSIAEPRLKVMRYPGTIQLEQADDELGHSLLVRDAEGKPVLRSDMKFQQDTSSLQFRIYLKPVAGMGRRMAMLKGTIAYMVQTEAEPVVLEDPFGMKETVKTVGGMSLTFSPAVWEEENLRWTMAAHFVRGTMPAEQWESTKQALAGMRPKLTVSDATRNKIDMSWAAVTAEGEVNAKYAVWLPRPRGPQPAGRPEVPRVEFELPTAAREVVAPVEFRNLPLR
jgi:hypothetical protein